jgi:hypothetical protein
LRETRAVLRQFAEPLPSACHRDVSSP